MALIGSIDTEQLNTRQILDRYSLQLPSLIAQAKNSLILPGGLGYGGFNYWDGTVNQQGNSSSAEGLSINGSRSMAGQAIVNVIGGN